MITTWNWWHTPSRVRLCQLRKCFLCGGHQLRQNHIRARFRTSDWQIMTSQINWIRTTITTNLEILKIWSTVRFVRELGRPKHGPSCGTKAGLNIYLPWMRTVTNRAGNRRAWSDNRIDDGVAMANEILQWCISLIEKLKIEKVFKLENWPFEFWK